MKDIGCFTALVVVAILAFVGLILWVALMLEFPGQRAQIEQLRADAAVVDPAQAEDVIGQVTQWNQTIVTMRTYNDMFLLGIFIPDEWDSVETIPVPVTP